jgi:hypothetical protein
MPRSLRRDRTATLGLERLAVWLVVLAIVAGMVWLGL